MLAPYPAKTHDDYMTPAHAWEAIRDFIPKNKIIWEAFYGDGTSGEILRNMGFDVIHEDVDFFKNNLGDIIVSNPPFSQSRPIVQRMAELDKPFILIMPTLKLLTNYFREAFAKKGIQIIIPRKRIQFIKIVNGEPSKQKSVCSFDCYYYCYKIGLPSDIVWLEWI